MWERSSSSGAGTKRGDVGVGVGGGIKIPACPGGRVGIGEPVMVDQYLRRFCS